MAGSLSHIIAEDGSFRMDLIENLGDAHEALSECFHLILMLSEGNMGRVSEACHDLGFPDPYENLYGDNPKKPMRSAPEPWRR